MASNASPIGCVGRLTVATRGADGPGEVLISLRGGREAYLAWSDSPLPRGAMVMVYDTRGERALDVMEWADQSDSPGGAPVT